LGIPHNDFEATQYFRLAANQGDIDARFAYGVCLAKRLGIRPNATEAARYFRSAAGKAHLDAGHKLLVALRKS
jgi:TPR repeat protein